jgi:hypothetical protein
MKNRVNRYIKQNLRKEMRRATYGTIACCYLAGPIGKVHLRSAKTWRINIKEELAKMGIGWIDPFEKYGDELSRIRSNLLRWNKEGNIDKIRVLVRSYIIPPDIESVQFVDFIIAYLPASGSEIECPECKKKIDCHAEVCGTYGEVTHAFYKDIPVYIVTDRPLKPNTIPNWGVGCSTKIFKSFDDLLKFLNEEWVKSDGKRKKIKN